MSQYGAYGYAQHGSTFQQILAHYYPGTTLGPAPVTTIRVLLADKKKALTIASEVPFTVRDGAGRSVPVDAGTLKLTPALTVAGTKLTAPLRVLPGKGGPLTLTRAYRGRIDVDVVDGRLRALNVLPLEQYLYGVVPAEMPSAWAPEALKSQAVAARSYALATRQVGAPFDVYSDTRSQMYLGIASETPATNAAVERDEAAGALLQGHDRDDVLLVDVGREDGVEPGLDRNGAPVPRVRPGSVRRHLAVPRLGPRARHLGDDREGAEADRRHHGRDDDAGRQRARRATQLRHAVHAGQRPRDEASLGDRPALDVVHRRPCCRSRRPRRTRRSSSARP